MADESIHYKIDRNNERIRSEIIISSSNMTTKQAKDIIKQFDEIGFDISIGRKDNQVCIIIKMLDVFKKG